MTTTSTAASSPAYETRRSEIEAYFDRTAAATWQRLTSDAPVSGIRATVRAGRDRMRNTLLSWLPDDLRGARILDAGCGTGALAMAAAERGAAVTAVDLSPTLIAIARERAAAAGVLDRISFHAGDMLLPPAGRYDHVVAMDALIHYRAAQMVGLLSVLAALTDRSILFTYAPHTPALAVMHSIGRLFPRSDRAPAIEPVGGRHLSRLLRSEPALGNWTEWREARITSGFYMSCGKELVPA